MDIPDDASLYAVHALYWAAFAVGRLLNRSGPAAVSAAAAPAPTTARFGRALLVFHMIGFGLMYAGIGDTVLGGHRAALFPGQRIVGGALIVLGAWIAVRAMRVFSSWRFRAAVDAGHQLCREGPFRWVRHPIYLSLALLGLGTEVWTPNAFTAAGAIFLVVGADLRARAEEKVLTAAFGDAYREYMRTARRFIPGVY